MRTQFTIAAIGMASIAAIAACSGSSGTGTAGAGTSSSGGASSGASSSGASSGSTSSGGNGSSGASSGGASSGSTSSGGTSSGATSSGGTSGTASGSGGSSGASGGSSSGEGGAAALTYPAGPYCADAGQNGAMATGCVIPNLTWMGYVDNSGDALATTKPYVMYSLLDLYNDAHVSGTKYAMINIAEFECPGCQNSAMEMGASTNGGASVDQAGGILIEVLMTAGFISPPTMSDLNSWVEKYNLSFTVVADLSTSLTTNNTLGRRDQAYIIDLTTMKILQYIDGSIVADGNNNSGALGMAAMHKLLGK
jgi:hypothetical protein